MKSLVWMTKPIDNNCYLGIVSGRDSSGGMAKVLAKAYASRLCDVLSDGKEQ